MNIPANPHFRPWTVFVAIVSLSILNGCDETRASIGGSGDETSTVAFYRPDGKPAAGARVMIYGSADTGISPRDQVIADSRGSVDLPVLDKGFYNLVVREDGTAIFQDSLFSNGERILAASDTLRATGVLVGRLRVQPQHSPRIAWVHLLGAGKYLNVDDSGFFRMEGVPQGKFTMAALTRLSHYTPTFKEVRAVSDSVVDVGGIDLVYTGLPVVKNLQAQFDTLAGLVHLRWDSLSLRETWRYNVYRDDLLVGQTTGHRWIDTVSDEYPGNVPGQGVHTYQVRMASVDSVGPKWESITMRIISAYLYEEVKIDWEKLTDIPWNRGKYRLDTAGTDLVCWQSRFDSIQYVQFWRSTDSGRVWNLVSDSLRITTFPIRFRGKWWALMRRIQEHPQGSVLMDTVEFIESQDGLDWKLNSVLVSNHSVIAWNLVQGDSSVNVYATSNYMQHELVVDSWKWNGITFLKPEKNDPIGKVEYNTLMSHEIWSGRWWYIEDFGIGGQLINGHQTHLPAASYSNYSIFSIGDRVLLFGSEAWSMDTSFSEIHTVQWPGAIWDRDASGFHHEIIFQGNIVSASDAGVYLGRIMTGSSSDPRGAWVKKTEIPVQY